jgi:peptidylprolyl isomerase
MSISKPEVDFPGSPPPADLEITDIWEGEGKVASAGDMVQVHYVGVAHSTGEEFDASWNRGEPLAFRLGAGQVIAGWDQGVQGMKVGGRRQLGSAIRHGETDCLEAAGRLPASSYARATMYTTLSPCDMCTGAILLYGIPRVVMGENDTFTGAEERLRARGVELVNLRSQECVDLMSQFIRKYPEIWNEDIGK